MYEVQKAVVAPPDFTKLSDITARFTWTTSIKYYLRAGHVCSCYVFVLEMHVENERTFVESLTTREHSLPIRFIVTGKPKQDLGTSECFCWLRI